MDILFKKASKNYGNLAFVNDVDLEIRQGKKIVVVGELGQGKTTFLKLIAGLEELSSGKIFFDNVDSNLVSIENRKISLLLEKPLFFEQKSISFNLNFALKTAKKQKDCEYFNKLERNLEKFGLKDKLKTKVKKLSLFEKIKLSILRATIKNPEIVLIDNVLSKLENEQRKEVLDMFNELFFESNATVVFCLDSQNMFEDDRFDYAFLNFGEFFGPEKLVCWKKNLVSKIVFDAFFEAKIKIFGKIRAKNKKFVFESENENFEILSTKLFDKTVFETIETVDCLLVFDIFEKKSSKPAFERDKLIFDVLDGKRLF